MNESAGSKNRLAQIAAATGNVVRTLAARAPVLGGLAIPSWRRLGQAAQVTIVLALVFILIAWPRWDRGRARVREAARLALFKKQTDADIAQLRNLAASAVREAHVRALRVQSLEARRSKAEQAAEELRRHLVSLQREESNEIKQVATLPTSEVAIRVAARLGIVAPGFSPALGFLSRRRTPEISAR